MKNPRLYAGCARLRAATARESRHAAVGGLRARGGAEAYAVVCLPGARPVVQVTNLVVESESLSRVKIARCSQSRECKHARPVVSSASLTAYRVHEHSKAEAGDTANSLPAAPWGTGEMSGWDAGTWVACPACQLGSSVGGEIPNRLIPSRPPSQPTTVAVFLCLRFRRRRRLWLPRCGHKQSASLLQITKARGGPGSRLALSCQSKTRGVWGCGDEGHRCLVLSVCHPSLMALSPTLTLAPVCIAVRYPLSNVLEAWRLGPPTAGPGRLPVRPVS